MTIILIVSSVSDIKEYRIPNSMIVFGWIAGILFCYRQNGLAGMGAGLINMLIVILVAWPFFFFRVLGAGDIKLFSVISTFYGVLFLVKNLILMLFFAGVFALYRLLSTGMIIDRFRYLFRYICYDRKSGYYVPERDGRQAVICLTPFLAIAYYILLLV